MVTGAAADHTVPVWILDPVKASVPGFICKDEKNWYSELPLSVTLHGTHAYTCLYDWVGVECMTNPKGWWALSFLLFPFACGILMLCFITSKYKQVAKKLVRHDYATHERAVLLCTIAESMVTSCYTTSSSFTYRTNICVDLFMRRWGRFQWSKFAERATPKGLYCVFDTRASIWWSIGQVAVATRFASDVSETHASPASGRLCGILMRTMHFASICIIENLLQMDACVWKATDARV